MLEHPDQEKHMVQINRQEGIMGSMHTWCPLWSESATRKCHDMRASCMQGACTHIPWGYKFDHNLMLYNLDCMASYTENSLPVHETYIVGEQITKIINIPCLWMCPPC
jgi:hypothetical protein